jgi:hypothetical protein
MKIYFLNVDLFFDIIFGFSISKNGAPVDGFTFIALLVLFLGVDLGKVFSL